MKYQSVAQNMKKTAERKGWIDPKIKKTASSQPAIRKFSSAASLYENVISLAFGLKEKGFWKEAQELETKAIQHKIAENNLYNLLSETGEDWIDRAHPDGSVKMFDSQEQEGVIENAIEQHVRMRELVQKEPNKKLAQLLGLDKRAQEAPPAVSQDDLEEITTDEQTKAKVEGINNFLAENWPEIGAGIRSSLAAAGFSGEEKLSSTLSFNPNVILNWGDGSGKASARTGTNADGTGGKSTLDYFSLFVKHAKVSGQELKDFLQIKNMWYGSGTGGDFTPQTVAARIFAVNNYSTLKQMASKVAADVASKYFYGAAVDESKIENYQEKAAKDERLIKNDSSVWIPNYDLFNASNSGGTFAINKQKVSEAANAIHAKMKEVFDRLVTNNLQNANQSLAADLAELLQSLAGLVSAKNKINFSNPPIVSRSTGGVTSALLTAQDILSRYSASGDLGKSLLNIFVQLNPSTNFFAQIKNANDKIEILKRYLADPKNILNPATDIIPPKETYQGIAENFRLSAARLKKYLDSLKEQGATEKDPNYLKYNNLMLQAVGAFKLANSGTNKPYGAIAEQIQKLFPKSGIKDLAGFQAEGDSWVQGTATLAPPNKTSNMKNNLEKFSGFGDYDSSAPKAKTDPSPKPAGQTPAQQTAPKPTGQAQTGGGKISEEEKSAVQEMQLALFTLGQYLKAYGKEKVPEMEKNISGLVVALMRTGPGLGSNATKNQFDGFWGPNTANAVKAAETVRLAWNKTSPQEAINDALVIGPLRNKPETIPTAQKNSDIIIALIRAGFGGEVSGGSEGKGQKKVIYDQLPDQINEGSINILIGRHPLSNNDLLSLANLYDFLVNNGIERPQFSGDVEGWSATRWQQILDWLARRSQMLLENSDKNNKALRLAYRRAINDLQKSFNAYLSQTGTGFTDIIPVDALRNWSQGAGSSGGQRGSSGGQSGGSLAGGYSDRSGGIGGASGRGAGGYGQGAGNAGAGGQYSSQYTYQYNQYGNQYGTGPNGQGGQGMAGNQGGAGGFGSNPAGNREPGGIRGQQGPGGFGGSGRGGQGQGGPGNQGGTGGPGFPGGGQGEYGRQLRRPPPQTNAPPIGEILDFRNEFWTMNYQDLPYPIVKLNQFMRTPVNTLSQMLFAQSNNPNPQSDYSLLLRSGFAPQTVRWNGEDFEIYLPSSDGQYYWYKLQELKKVPWFIQRFPVLAARDRNPIDQLEIFLLQLTKSLHATAQNWYQTIEPTEEELDISMEWSKRWQQAIQQKLRQIQHWRSQR